jgi:CubicO group peptidase (beta-lactamase class C family)
MKTIIISLVILMTGSWVRAQRVDPGGSNAPANVQSIDSLVRGLHQTEGFDGNVLVADKGKIVYQKSVGPALTENSLFNLASVSNVFTAVAVMQLVEQGQLDLSTNIYQFFPNLPYKDVTIWHLLTHTSGLEDYPAEPVRNILAKESPTNADIEEAYAFAHPKARFYPDSNWRYSNTNYPLLAMIVEKLSGEPFPRYVWEHLFCPSGMRHSFVLRKNVPKRLRKNIVTPRDSSMENVYGGGEVFSTTGDLFKFFTALRRGRLLKRATMTQMYQVAPLLTSADYEAGNAHSDYASGYGLGWIVAKDVSRGRVVWLGGAGPGTLTFFMQNIAKGRCVVVLNNNGYRGAFHLGGNLMNILAEKPYLKYQMMTTTE